MTHPNLDSTAAEYVIKYFKDHPHQELYYHNLDHTQTIAARVAEIAHHYQLSEEEEEILVIAAWFHDTGHLTGGMEGHELRSVEVMKNFMAGTGINDQAFTEQIEKCILATQFPHQPHGLLEEIICDADTYHFGTIEFRKTNKKMREELKARKYTALTDDWLVNSEKLLMKHHYFTEYAKQLLQPGKLENLNWLHEKINKKKKLRKEEPVFLKENKKTGEQQFKQQQGLVSRGVQTMIRLTSGNHLELSQMADSKANILISVNAIIISVILSVLVRKMEAEPFLIIPTIIFLASSVITIVLAILATQPKITNGNFTRDDILNRKTNLLFFGNFYKASLEEYEWAMNYMMQDKEYLYGSLIKDIYFLGVVLGKKYKLIRIAYMVFMIGIIISVIAFVVASLLYKPEHTTTIINGSDAAF